jgi:hypothetical protein
LIKKSSDQSTTKKLCKPKVLCGLSIESNPEIKDSSKIQRRREETGMETKSNKKLQHIQQSACDSTKLVDGSSHPSFE